MYTQLISTFRNFSVLVIGDLMLDVYLRGGSTRLTPEAPVPVVDVLSSTMAPGGAANTAANLASLGAKVSFCSVCGQDAKGDEALQLLLNAGVQPLVLQSPSRQTIVKTRVMAGNQLLVRYDSGTETALNKSEEATLITWLTAVYTDYDAVVIADYHKGILTAAIVETLELLQQQYAKFLAVDSRRLQTFRRLSPSLVKPNYAELLQLLRMDPVYESRAMQVSELGPAIYAATGAAITAVTLDEEGAVIFNEERLTYRCCARDIASAQVAGAGDTYISAFVLACLGDAAVQTAAELSAAAASVVIGKQTTTCCTHQELNAYLSVNEKYVTDLQQLEYLCAIYRAQGRKIIFTNGCFDILHSGHVNYLNRARELGHVLIVGINTDDSIRRLKGASRPINSLQDRIDVLAGLGAVNHIIAFGSPADDTSGPLILAIRPHIFAKGGDYTLETVLEAPLVKQLGGEVVLLPLLPERSTTLILHRIHNKVLDQIA
jgi:D-beta-D-heptose 7-phosphate kinase / D-beta-D-heptose 1-phosphate adenosyltransferase